MIRPENAEIGMKVVVRWLGWHEGVVTNLWVHDDFNRIYADVETVDGGFVSAPLMAMSELGK